ncbi:GNAT family N-acetyltransferase [Anaerolineales bacterium HSG6]|nr:GNAT family N-acetyltransferase [Anaerolineales bacterium HSG6]MDM8531562.1 GNAT family N-acetyltransferase [Anaerolineales bacterium HSG25]
MSTIDLISASAFSYQELTDAYNRTRVDYMVPMPMNASKLREYVITYNIDMKGSAVAIDGNEVLGLSMLGSRPGRAWISRLGVVRQNRRNGAGTALVQHMIDESKNQGANYIIIEVIDNNVPAHTLFTRLGFKQTRQLLVLGRPPGPPKIKSPVAQVRSIKYNTAMELLTQRRSKPTWIEETDSLTNAGNIEAFYAKLQDGSEGWLVCQNTIFQLSRIMIQTEVGDPMQVGRALLYHLHKEYSKKDTKTENLPVSDPHWPVFKEMGYFDLFRRNEMVLEI